jgi:hypothetical protein
MVHGGPLLLMWNTSTNSKHEFISLSAAPQRAAREKQSAGTVR